jgi:hypothetical protein
MSIYDNLDRAAAHAYDAGVLAERERIRQLAIEWKASYWATKNTPGGGIAMEFPFADLLTDPDGGHADGT